MHHTSVFEIADQLKFAEISGDFNPIHVDSVYSRRSPIGLVVHGVHLVLRALEVLFAEYPIGLARLNVVFLRPVAVGEPISIECELEEDAWRINLRQSNSITTSIRLEAGERRPWDIKDHPRQKIENPAIKRFEELANESGVMPVSGQSEILRGAFPNLARAVGTGPIAVLNSLSELVGMRCPGLNSLFCGFDLRLNPCPIEQFQYQVLRLLSPKAPFKIKINGEGIFGELTVIVRPAPVRQTAYRDLLSIVEPGEFAGRKILVIGGSRGLGEVTAKLLAKGGARVWLTYHHGENEACAVRYEIDSGGGFCEVRKLNVLELIGEDLNWISSQNFDQIYYFATPSIKSNSSEVFNPHLYQKFRHFYVDAFSKLICNLSDHPCQIFYPSTIYIEDRPKEFAEYVKAKAEGEALANRSLKAFRKSIRVIVSRLPRTNTDQTNSLVQGKVESAVNVMLPIIRKLFQNEDNMNVEA